MEHQEPWVRQVELEHQGLWVRLGLEGRLEPEELLALWEHQEPEEPQEPVVRRVLVGLLVHVVRRVLVGLLVLVELAVRQGLWVPVEHLGP